MNDFPEKPLSSEILNVLMGSNPQINGILRVSELMYVCVYEREKERVSERERMLYVKKYLPT